MCCCTDLYFGLAVYLLSFYMLKQSEPCEKSMWFKEGCTFCRLVDFEVKNFVIIVSGASD
jgi:hypothetical protein